MHGSTNVRKPDVNRPPTYGASDARTHRRSVSVLQWSISVMDPGGQGPSTYGGVHGTGPLTHEGLHAFLDVSRP